MNRRFTDGVFRAVIRNASYLGSTKLLGAPLSLAGAGMAYLFGTILMTTFMLAPTLSGYWRRRAAEPVGRVAGAGL